MNHGKIFDYSFDLNLSRHKLKIEITKAVTIASIFDEDFNLRTIFHNYSKNWRQSIVQLVKSWHLKTL